MSLGDPKYYDPLEERWNIISHGFGFLLSIIAAVILIVKASQIGDVNHIVSFSIFGGSMILLYAASTFYHAAKSRSLRTKLNVLDHASIYVLIAGTYTPFALVTLNGTTGWTIFIVVWSLALIGIILKLFYTGKYQLLSTIMYVVMGWIIIFAINPLIQGLSTEGLWWLFGGGISYSLGAVLFMLDKKVPFNHAIFHIFVLFGTFCHFISIYFYVLPVTF